ncbi:type IV fimbrial biogenesis PilY1-related protein, partial [mine drainage metagenome]
MQIGASSDDPNINDVLYMQGSSNLPVFITYNGPSPPNPYTAYTLTDYNTNLSSIKSSYLSTYPNIGGWSTYPTNAGYIPFSPQVMYSLRGFGYGANQSASTGHLVVPMTSAGQAPTTSSVATAISQFSQA